MTRYVTVCTYMWQDDIDRLHAAWRDLILAIRKALHL